MLTHARMITIAGLATIAAGARAQTYTIIDLTPTHEYAQAWSISDSGRVSGGILTPVAEGALNRAFDWNGAAVVLDPPAGSGESVGINARDTGTTAIIYTTGTLVSSGADQMGTSLVASTPIEPSAVNASNTYAGWSDVINAFGLHIRTASTYDTAIHVLPGLGGDGSSALDINDAGYVVGSAVLGNDIDSHAVVWTSTASVHDLGTLGGDYSQAVAINDNLLIAGDSHTASNEIHAVVTQIDAGGAVVSRTDLGVLSGNFSYAYDLNNNGTVVGTSDSKAFIWDGSTITDLNTLIPVGSGWNLRNATGINNNGEIVGWGTIGNRYAAFKLIPGCLADFNGDGTSDFFDVQAFLQAFAALDPAADLNGDGLFDFFDVQAFLQAFSAGCGG